MKSFLVADSLVFELVSQDLNLLSHKSYDSFCCCKKLLLSGSLDDLSFSTAQIRERKTVYECMFSLCRGLSYLCFPEKSGFILNRSQMSVFFSHLSLVCFQFNRAQESCLGDEHLGPDFCSHCRDVVWSERFPPTILPSVPLYPRPDLQVWERRHMWLWIIVSLYFPSLFHLS